MKAVIKNISFFLITLLAVLLTLIFRKSLDEKRAILQTPPENETKTSL